MWTSKSKAFCELVGIEYPIIQAPMAGGPTTSQLVSTVSSNGALGSVGAGYLRPEMLSNAIAEIRSKTAKAFSVNLMVPPSKKLSTDISPEALSAINGISKAIVGKEVTIPQGIDFEYAQQLEVVIQAQVRVVTATFGVFSSEEIGLIKNVDLLCGATATCVEEAKHIERIGCDFVIAQGYEAGGHRGGFLEDGAEGLVGTLALIPQVVDAVKIPVVASGGIMDGRGIVAALALGASAVQMGTAFLGTSESGASSEWKDRLQIAADIDTTLTRSFSGKTARGIRNEYIKAMHPFENELPSYPVMNKMTSEIRAAAQVKHNAEFQSLWAGQAAKLARRVGAAELILQLLDQVKTALRDFSR